MLQNAATNSSGAADPIYDALKAAHQQAQDDRLANYALIRGILESHLAEPDNFKDTRKAAPTTPPTSAATQAGHPDPPITPSPPGFATPPVTPRDHIFSGVKIASAYLYLLEYHALKWPSNDDRASLMERISIRALRASMVLPVLLCRSRGLCHTCRARRLLRGNGGTPGQLHAPVDGIP